MALPASLGTVTVQGTYVNLLGNPISGSITFQPQTVLKETTANVIVIPSYITKELDANGAFTVVLPATSDVDVAPIPFSYQVVENFTNGRTFTLSLPTTLAGTIQNLADLVPSVLAPQATGYVTTDQYGTLLSRYTADEAARLIVVDTTTYVENSDLYEAQAQTAMNQLWRYNANALMLMGV